MLKGLTDGSEYEFAAKNVANKGRCLFLRSQVAKKDTFLMEYSGDLITPKQAYSRERLYRANGEGCFMINFNYQNKRFIMDATRRYHNLARLLNHSKKPNCKLHGAISTDPTTDTPRLAIYALHDIYRNQELTLDYGIRLKTLTWLQSEDALFLDSIAFDRDETRVDEDVDMSFSFVQCEPINQPVVELSELFPTQNQQTIQCEDMDEDSEHVSDSFTY